MIIKIFKLTILAGSLSFTSQVSSNSVSFENTAQNKTPKHSQRIIGGREASATSYPFMTALISAASDDIRPFCGASYIGGRYVLTAAHCLVGTNANDIDVWIGGFDITAANSGKRVKVAQIYNHESYDDFTVNNDIAVLELAEEVINVEPINIITPEIEAELNDGFEFTVMGWGNMNTEGFGEFPNKLQEVNVPLYNREQCKADYTREGETDSDITEQMFCAGFVEGGKDSCQGDSGGPLVFKHNEQWYQAGIVSFGNGCAAANAPGVYARLSQFNQWLEQKKAGVSYLQYSRLGYVEKTYDEQTVFTVKNVSPNEFSVTQANINTLENLDQASISENLCTDRVLEFNDSCDIKVDVKTNMLGRGDFTLSITTTNTANPQADMFFSSTTLEQESLSVSDLVGSDDNVINWWGGGDLNWQTDTSQAAQGESSIASGNISHYESSVLLATIYNDRAKTFNFKHLVSSEDGYDKLRVLHNNKLVHETSGTHQTDFETTAIPLAEGNDRIAFIYSKDSTDEDDIGSDKAYIDQVSTDLINASPVVQLDQTQITVEEGSSFILDASASSDPDDDPITYQWEVTSTAKIVINSPTSARLNLIAPSYKDAKNLTFKLTVTDALGATSTATVEVTIKEKPKSSGGSFGFMLLPLLLLLFRRKF